jgi:hypothetical protein
MRKHMKLICTECKICGVAYDFGANYCREQKCEQLVLSEHPYLGSAIFIDKTINKTQKSIKIVDRVYSRLNSIRYRSIRKGLEFSLTYDDVKELIEGECEYCGSMCRIEIDRKDPKLGYTKDNTCSACRRCNTLKNNVATYDEMKSIALALRWRDAG